MHPSPSTSVKRPALREVLELHGYVLLYDGVCGLCNRFVQWVIKHDRAGTMRFATLQGAYGQDAMKSLPDLARIDSVVLLSRHGALIKSTAALEVARYLGGLHSLLLAGYLLPRGLRDGLYDFIARRRYGWFGKLDACPIPPAATKERFLDG